MRKKWTLAAAMRGCLRRDGRACRHRIGRRDAQATINRLQDEGYTVNIDRTGTAPLSECVVTNVRNPKTGAAVGALHRPRPQRLRRRPRAGAGNHQPVDLGDAGLQPPLTRIWS